MQARLDKWRSNPLPVKTLIEARKKGTFVLRKENKSDIDTKEEYELLEEKKNNPFFKGYT
jgi:hypothetical protein